MTAADPSPRDEAERLALLSFEQLLEELEATIARMATGSLGLEEVTELHERAGRLHDAAAERLAAIEARIERLAAPGD